MARLREPSPLESQQGENSEFEIRYYLCSLKTTPEKALGILRRHWGIEDGLHRTLDVLF